MTGESGDEAWGHEGGNAADILGGRGGQQEFMMGGQEQRQLALDDALGGVGGGNLEVREELFRIMEQQDERQYHMGLGAGAGAGGYR